MNATLDKFGSGVGVLASPQPPTLVVEALKRTALDHLGTVTRGLYRPIEHALHQIELEAPGTRLADQEALAMLRQREAALVMRYRQLLADSFDELLANPAQGGGRTPLSLLSEDELEQHLDGQRIAVTLTARHAKPLEALVSRFSSLRDHLGLDELRCPAVPGRLSGLLVGTLQGQVMPPGLRTLLFKQYESELTRILDPFYQQLSTQLGSAGYGLHDGNPMFARPAPAPMREAPQAERWEQAAASQPQTAYTRASAQGGRPAGPAHSSHGDGATAGAGAWPASAAHGRGAMADAGHTPHPYGNGDMVVSQELVRELGMLREQLHVLREQSIIAATQRSGTSSSRPGMQRRPLRTDELRSVANVLQGDKSGVFAEALAHGGGRLQATLRHELLDGARRLGLDPERTALSAEEEDAIDLVGLLFEAICDVHRLWDVGRNLLSRLVLPYLKLALNDDSLFVQPSHPARRLLDVLTEACESNQGTTPHDRELLDRATQAVERVIAEYQEDLSIFELAATELNDLLAQQRRRVELAERRAAEAAFGRERLLQARHQAAVALVQCVRDYRLTAPVRQFLSEHWQHHLVQTLLRDGSDSARHIGAMNLGQSLVEIDLGAASAQGATIADRLIQLMPLLRDCLASSGLEANAADEAVARLVRALAWPDVPRSTMPSAPIEPFEAAEAQSSTLRLVSNGGQREASPDATAAMRRLSQGDWVRLIDDDGFERALKIAWISPLTSRFLIVNRRGMRELVATADQLALLAQQGRLIVGLPDAPFEGAMKQVWKHLQQAA
ncbi:MAG: DUF1631 domain-containing protein [Lysobacter sp.]|nr:DUF1631 domain-containing protein [Lysobacter sp.]